MIVSEKVKKTVYGQKLEFPFQAVILRETLPECLRNRDKLTSRQLNIAKDYYLMGLSMRRIAAKRRWSYYRVRDTIIEIRNIVNAPQRKTG